MPIASSHNANNKQVAVVANKLIPDDSGLPPLYATEDDKDPIVKVKLFFPAGHYTAFLTEYDPKTKTGFGWCEAVPGGGELGYIDVNELEEIEIRGLKIERDEQFTPRPLSQAIDEFQNGPGTRVNTPQTDLNEGRGRG